MIAFDHCVVAVSDWERSNAFYRDVLGAELVERGANGWAYRFGSQQLNLHGPGVHTEIARARSGAARNSDLCFRWDGPIEDAVSHLAQHDVEVELGPVPREGARRRGHERLLPRPGRLAARADLVRLTPM